MTESANWQFENQAMTNDKDSAPVMVDEKIHCDSLETMDMGMGNHADAFFEKNTDLDRVVSHRMHENAATSTKDKCAGCANDHESNEAAAISPNPHHNSAIPGVSTCQKRPQIMIENHDRRMVKESMLESGEEICGKGSTSQSAGIGGKDLSEKFMHEESEGYQYEPGKIEEREPQNCSATAERIEVDTSGSFINDNDVSTLPFIQSSQSKSSSTAAVKRIEKETKGAQFIPLKSSAPERGSSLLTKGISLFTRSSKQMKSDNDAGSVVSEMTLDTKADKPAPALEKSYDDALRLHLEESGLILLRRLIEFLSEFPPAPEEYIVGQEEHSISNQNKKQRGLTLPASAIGWLSTQINDSTDELFECTDDCYRTPKHQLRCLHMLLRRVRSLRISGEAWPPINASTTKAKNTINLDKNGMSSKILSKFAGDHSTGGDSLDDESCATSPSPFSSGNETKAVASPFQRYYHELQHKPKVDMSFFPNATKVVIDGIPPNWVENLHVLQSTLDMFQMERGCILDINQLFFPSDYSNGKLMPPPNHESSFVLGSNPSLIDEVNEKGLRTCQEDGVIEVVANPVMYSSLSKLRLSNCAIGEAAGLRGYKSVPRMPTFNLFPNLVSLNLSQNELFKTKTVFVGLSSLPLLSSINLSYNRFNNMDDVFLYIGNITELILTGNEISSTRGLDRLFSLEQLSLDENKIHNLASIAGIAKLPFLMNFDLKGNPLVTNDPDSCRIKVFNLFREVRCSNLPKNATFRDMQGLLPILDDQLASKDELISLKDLTFRQTLMPVDSALSPENRGGCTDKKMIDDSTEISVDVSVANGSNQRIVKISPSKIAHFRMAGLKDKAAWRSQRSQKNVDNPSVEFNMTKLIASIRPEIESCDRCNIREGDENLFGGIKRATSFSSHHSEFNHGTANTTATASTSPIAFPFNLPQDLLADADEDVWNSTSLLDQIVSPIVWDEMSRDGGFDHNLKLSRKSEDSELNNHAPDIHCGELPENIKSQHDGDPFFGETQLILLCEGQDSAERESILSAVDDAHGDGSDPEPRSTIFGGIWEQSYHQNMMRNKEQAVESVDVAKRRDPEVINFNSAEQNSLYDGPSDYSSLYVASDLDLYFDSYVFNNVPEDGMQEVSSGINFIAPRIQLFKFDRDMFIDRKSTYSSGLPLGVDLRERYVGVWKENVLACGTHARSRLPPVKVAKRGFHGDIITHMGNDVMISESRKFILCLSDCALYFIIDDDNPHQNSVEGKRTFPSRIPPESTFSNACWPHAVMRHPLDCLHGITIGFQFQRLILRFYVGNAKTTSSFEYAYVVLTSNKLQTVSLLQKLQSHFSSARMGIDALIENDDKCFLDALGTAKSNEVVIHYQIVHQFWKRGDRGAARRAFVLTDWKVYLLDESYTGDGTKPDEKESISKKLGGVSLSIIDSAILRRVTEVRAAYEDPRKITLVILPQTKLKRSHRWRLVCNDGEGAERLIDDVRKAIRAMQMT